MKCLYVTHVVHFLMHSFQFIIHLVWELFLYKQHLSQSGGQTCTDYRLCLHAQTSACTAMPILCVFKESDKKHNFSLIC
jgi:hypothetical protein